MPKIRTAGWFPRRGEVYWGRVDKVGPVLVISVDAINRQSLDVTLVPMTTKESRKFALRVPLPAGEGGLAQPSWAKCDQVTTVEKSLLRYPAIGRVSQDALRNIEEAIRLALGLV